MCALKPCNHCPNILQWIRGSRKRIESPTASELDLFGHHIENSRIFRNNAPQAFAKDVSELGQQLRAQQVSYKILFIPAVNPPMSFVESFVTAICCQYLG